MLAKAKLAELLILKERLSGRNSEGEGLKKER